MRLFWKMDEARLSALWREKSRRYVAAVNAYVERGLREGWDKAGSEPEDDRANLAPRVLAAVRAANKSGNTASLRQKFPPAYEPFLTIINEKGQELAPIAWIDDSRIALRLRPEHSVGPVTVVQHDGIVEQARVRSFGRSADRRFFALAFDEGVKVREGWDGRRVAFLPWPTGREGLPAESDGHREFDASWVKQLVVFPDGQRVLITCADGVFVLSAAGATRLLPTPAQYDRRRRDDPNVALNRVLSMVHGAVSRRGDLVLAGHQDSMHVVFDAKLEQIAEIPPACSYPHFAWFSADGEVAAFNACHFYNGTTIGIRVADLDRVYTPFDERDVLRTLEDGARVYAAVARGDEFIIGDAVGYLRAFDVQGNFRWQHFVGATISALDLSPDQRKLAVASHGGILCVLELDAQEPDPFAIGTASQRELQRWLFWKGEEQVLNW